MCKLYVLLFFSFLKLIRSDSVTFHDCGSEYYLFEVDIEGCTYLPCYLTIGGQHRISMGIYANSKSEDLRQEVYLILRTIYRKIEVTPENPCTQIACPVSNNLDVSFSAIIYINRTLVPLDGELYWRLFNEENKTVVCMRTDIALQIGST